MRLKIEKQNEKYIKQANRHRKFVEFQEGDLVWINLRNDIFPQGKFSKLKPKVDGLFKVLEKIGENAYKIELPKECDISPTYFPLFKFVKHFIEKWFYFQLTRKIFSVDHLFSVKHTRKC